MKKIIKSKSVVLFTFLFTLVLTSCDFHFFSYKPSEAFYRLMKVERRAKELKKLNISEDSDKALIMTNLRNSKNEEIPLKINSDEIYDVLIITDVHFGNEYSLPNGERRDNEWFKALEKEKSESGKKLLDSVKFAIGLGDFADHGLLKECEDYNREIRDPLEKKYGIPLYNIVGNHDLYNSGWDAWEKTMYPHTSFYKFETPSFSWYFLDSASGTLGGYQYDALENEMLNDSKEKLIFSHVPVYSDNYLYFTMQNPEERNRLINTCALTNTKFFIDGHTHKLREYSFGSFFEQNISDFFTSCKYAVLHVNELEKTISISIRSY